MGLPESKGLNCIHCCTLPPKPTSQVNALSTHHCMQCRTQLQRAAVYPAPMCTQAAGLDVELPDDSSHLRNQFNFSERAAQTFSFPLRDRATFTEPAPTATASGGCVEG